MTNIFPIDFEEKLTMAQDDYILFSDSEDGNKIKKAQYKNLKGEKWETWARINSASFSGNDIVFWETDGNSVTLANAKTTLTWPKWEDGADGADGQDWAAATITVGTTTTGDAWTSASVTNSWTSSAAVFNFTIPKWDKWDTGSTWSAATITVWSTTTWDAGTSASVVNSWTSSAAVLDFTIPKWDKGDTGSTWATGNGISSITSSKSWKITTVTITETNGNSDSFTVEDGADWQWSWDVIWPNSSTDWNVVLFDWTTWKLIKDSGVWLASKLDASALSDTNYWWAWNGDTTHTPTKNAIYTKLHTMDVEIWNKAADNNVVKLSWNQTVNGTKTFWTSPVVPSKTATATNTGTAIATEAQVYTVADAVSTINWMISSNASSSNKLMDKNYIDDSINSVTAYYITKNAQGDQWATYSELSNASTFYSWWVARTPTKNDYTIVLADENHDNATTRYIYNSGWEYQYTVNETALTQSQLDALNSWITAAKVTTYDGYSSTISWKQDALTLPATPTQWNLVVRWANNKTIADWWAVPTWVPSWWNNWDVLTNVSWTPTWSAPAGWDVQISSQSNNILTSWAKIWAWTSANYSSLWSYDSQTIYLVI